MNMHLKVGDPVEIHSYEGFGGPGLIIEERPDKGSRFKVRLDDGSQPDFWAHDHEVVPSGSGFETVKHILTVQRFMSIALQEIQRRLECHDESKLGPEEKPQFDRETPKLKALVYGSDDYKQSLANLGPALKHHYETNSHHPEHYANGINGMDLFDLIEMVCDWKAAAQRVAGDGTVNLEMNAKRFNIRGQLSDVIRNTIERFPD